MTLNTPTKCASSTVVLGFLACCSPIGCVIIGEVFPKAKMISKIGFISLGMLSVGTISIFSANRICSSIQRIHPDPDSIEPRLQVLINGPDYQQPQP